MRIHSIATRGAILASSVIATWLFTSQASAQTPALESSTTTTAPQAGVAAPYLRVLEDKGKSIALEIASRTYEPTDGTGPTVTLVGVVHIGDRPFYRNLEKMLADFDVVLYESVKPAGTGGAGGDTPEQRVQTTKEAMKFVGGLIEAYRQQHDGYPASAEELQSFAAKQDPRLRDFLTVAMIDAWGQPLVYERMAAKVEASESTLTPSPVKERGYSLMSLAADGKLGGADENADVTLSEQPVPAATELNKDDNLQVQLAEALSLEFQLEAMDYDRPNFRCSDMAVDEVDRRLQAKGLDFGLIGGTLAGSSLPAKMVGLLLGFMKMADAMLEGAIADTFKVVMIEILADPRIMDQGLAQLGKGFGDVIINDRNQVVIDDLKNIIANEPQTKSIAVFYGAGHMNDMVERLETQLGYRQAPGAENDRWLTAISVDYSASAVSASDINRIRMMIKQTLHQQFKSR